LNEILNELKLILQYEYLLSKEIPLPEKPENIVRLIELLLYVSDIDILSILLQVITIKVKNADFKNYPKKQDSQWQINLIQFIQTFVEFFTQINFSFIIEDFATEYKNNIEKQALCALLEKVDDLTSRHNSFIPTRDYLKNFIETDKELTDENFKELLRLFREANVQEIYVPDVYEISAVLGLINISREYFYRQDKRIFNVLFITETTRGKFFFIIQQIN